MLSNSTSTNNSNTTTATTTTTTTTTTSTVHPTARSSQLMGAATTTDTINQQQPLDRGKINPDGLGSTSRPDLNRPTSSSSSSFMSQKEFCLKWNSFEDNLVTCLSGAKEHDEFTDVTLATQSRKVEVHQLILAACSPYFRDLLLAYDNRHPIFILNGVTDDILNHLVTYMYTGQVFVPEDELDLFFRTAESLQIKGLVTPEKMHNYHHHHSSSAGLLLDLPPSSQTTAQGAAAAPANAELQLPGQSYQSPTGHLELLAAAATQRDSIANSGGGITVVKRNGRKAPPRRLETMSTTSSQQKPLRIPQSPSQNQNLVNGLSSSSSSKLPSLSSPPLSSSTPLPQQLGLLAGLNLSNDENNPHNNDNGTAMNLSMRVKKEDSFRPEDERESGGINSAATTTAMQIEPEQKPKVDYAAKAGLLNIPNPSAYTSSFLSGGGNGGILGGKQQQQQQQDQVASTARVELPSTPIDMSSALLRLQNNLPLPGVLPSSPPRGSAASSEGSEEGGPESGGGPPMQINDSTTIEEVEAMFATNSWKSRQPRACNVCNRMFSNKFNLKQVRRLLWLFL